MRDPFFVVVLIREPKIVVWMLKIVISPVYYITSLRSVLVMPEGRILKWAFFAGRGGFLKYSTENGVYLLH